MECVWLATALDGRPNRTFCPAFQITPQHSYSGKYST
jgi:hypothetical protein